MNNKLNDKLIKTKKLSNQKKLFDDIYSTTFKKLGYLDKTKLDKNFIKKNVENSLEFFSVQKDDFSDFEECIENLYKSFSVTTNNSSTISNNENHIDWYKASSKRPYWESHKRWLLENDKKPVDVVASIDKSTDEIMSLLEDPTRQDSWDRRGMVVGNVQSGKTSNFIALANKALDSGYKFIIILSGLTKDLRKQTHDRLDSGFFGFNTEHASIMDSEYMLPLGRIRQEDLIKRPNTLTNSGLNGDLSTAILRGAINFQTDDAKLFCIKKNKTTLQLLINYILKDSNVSSKIEIDYSNYKFKKLSKIKDQPILIIDDEVDHASVDTGMNALDEEDNPNEEYNPKTINRLIRTLLNMYERKSYVGYTATPFANVFIHPKAKTKNEGEDLFPKSFIQDLPEPSNYYGIKKLFSKEGDDIEESFLETIDDHCIDPGDIKCSKGWMPPKHLKLHEALFDGENKHSLSLRKAILNFIVSCSIRNLRGHLKQHKSMLIHVTKYILVNEQVKFQVIKTMDRFRSILLNPGTSEYDLLKEEVSKEIKEFSHKENYSFEDLMNFSEGIEDVIKDISLNIKNLSGNSGDTLDYETYKNKYNKGLQTIIIGGDRLSRGVTLEGLSVSYFLRASKMYDTLMQMGRWFGYRDDYEDLCKLFTTDDLIDWFYYIAEATEELKLQFRIMSEQNLTPRDFGLKVKSHPLLMVTSRVKMQHGYKIKSSFIDHFGQTTSFDLMKVDQNYKTAKKLFNKIGEPNESGLIKRAYGNESNSFVWKNIDSSNIINFLNSYEIHEDAKLVRPHFYAQYIKNLNLIDELNSWTIGLMGSGSTNMLEKICNKYEVNLLKRKARKTDEENKYSIGVLTNPNHQMLDLTEEEIKEIINKSSDKKDYGVRARQFRSSKNGLLLLYPIEKPNHKKSDSKLCFGFAISFPSSSKTKSDENSISYTVNNVYYNQEYLSN